MAGAGTTRSVTVVRVVVTRFAARLRITWRLTILCLGEMVVERTVRTVSTVSTGAVATAAGHGDHRLLRNEHRARLLGDDGFHWPIGDLARDHRLSVRGRCPGDQRHAKNCVGDVVSHRELHHLRVGCSDPSMPTQRAATLRVPRRRQLVAEHRSPRSGAAKLPTLNRSRAILLRRDMSARRQKGLDLTTAKAACTL